ncbi:hypothetical protein [Bacillus chungangensis]|uniref:Uncharacterized protein n=1 Tax=Bacillus chungangensis TaxID=587633 RepID=A0ABT9WTP2_9BACI|nr:hypothetical protein [Bacillus chungangensis]MDQ0176267.1 hypothetical protein [Bacillus chungangensis]
MSIEKLFIKRVAVDEGVDYKALYNDSRGAVYKDEYKSLIKEAIKKNIITIEKFIIAENVQDELYQICDIKGIQYTLIQCLKDYHNESDYVIAPIIYLLKILDPQFTLNTNEEKLKIVSKVNEVEVRSRIDGRNAMPRIFLPKENTAIASTNENIENLGDILAVKDVRVYVIGTDDCSNNIYAYKVNRNDRFFEVSKGFKERLINKIFKS